MVLNAKEKLEIMEEYMSVSWEEIDHFLGKNLSLSLANKIDTRGNWGLDWAESKYPLFEKFGNKLKLIKEVENTMSDKDIACSYRKLVMDSFSSNENITDILGKYFFDVELSDLQKNILSRDYVIDGKKISKGMKVSKSLKFFIENKGELNQVQIAFSRFKEELEAKGSLEISIDPMDILCMSVNETRSWNSCHNIFSGMYGAGPISYIVDSASAIAQIVDKRSENNVPEKVWRRMLIFDTNLDTVMMSRHYPSHNKNNANAVKDLLLSMSDNAAYGFVDAAMGNKISEDCEAHYCDLTRGANGSKIPMIVFDRDKYGITGKNADERTLRDPYDEGAFSNVRYFVGPEEPEVLSATGYYVGGDLDSFDAIDGADWDPYRDDDDDDYWD